jgi:hypothetical protein
MVKKTMPNMETVEVTYKYIDGAHFFVSTDKAADGLCVANTSLRIAYEDVADQLNHIYEINHGKKAAFVPAVPFDEFRRVTERLASVTKDSIEHSGSMMTPAMIQSWTRHKMGAA